LDLSKAFDRVWRDDLFALLWENGIKWKCWRLLRKMYEKVENKVIFGDFESEWFDQEFRLKQGCAEKAVKQLNCLIYLVNIVISIE
jgi:hypothetical protein